MCQKMSRRMLFLVSLNSICILIFTSINLLEILLCLYKLNFTIMLSRLNSVPFNFNPFHQVLTHVCVCVKNIRKIACTI